MKTKGYFDNSGTDFYIKNVNAPLANELNAYMHDNVLLERDALLENESLGKNAFYNCVNLKSFTVPEGITSILDNCFMNCENLEEIILPSSLKTVETNAFSNCKSLKKVIYLGENFEIIDIKDGNSALKSAFSYTY